MGEDDEWNPGSGLLKDYQTPGTPPGTLRPADGESGASRIIVASYTDDEIDVPVERPREFGTRAVLTDQEVAARAAEEARRARDDKSDRRPLREGQTGDGPEHWYEQPKTTSHRTSLITDPPDGRIPPFTAEGAKRAAKPGRPKGGRLVCQRAKRAWHTNPACSSPLPAPTQRLPD